MYVGCQAGGGWAGSRWLNNHFTGVETCTAAVNFNLQCDQVNQSSASFIGGGQIGKRWQTGPWVVGIEASLAYARFYERSADVNSAFAALTLIRTKPI